MAKISMFVGLMLSIVGIGGYVATGAESFTALIPLVLGVLIGVSGAITAKKPSLSVIFMHIAVTTAILGFVATLIQSLKLNEFGSVKSVSLWSSCVLCFILVGAYLQSFFKARANKEG